MLITDYIQKDCVIINLQADSREDVIDKLTRVQLDQYPRLDKTEAIQGLTEREKVLTTGIGKGVAIPHARLASSDQITVSVGLCKAGVNYNAVDEKPVHMIFLVFFPKDEIHLQLKFLATISRILNDETHRKRLENSQSPDEFIEILKQIEYARSH